MLLIPGKSLCGKKQKIIVSRDKGAPRVHRANNVRLSDVRQYRLDGDLVTQQACCDFLVLNDSEKKAYFIELKGRKTEEAIPQFEGGLRLCKDELEGYQFYFRIVSSKVRTQSLSSNTFRKFQDKYGSHLAYHTECLEEDI